MKVKFVDFNGIQRKGEIPQDQIHHEFVRLFGVDHGLFTVYRKQGDYTVLMLYRPVMFVRPDLVLFTSFKEEECEGEAEETTSCYSYL